VPTVNNFEARLKYLKSNY